MNQALATSRELDCAGRRLDPRRLRQGQNELLAQIEAATLRGVAFLPALGEKRVGIPQIGKAIRVVVRHRNQGGTDARGRSPR